MENSAVYLEKMFTFIRQAGALALKYMAASGPALKSDQSIITEADKAIARLCHQSLNGFLKDPAHVLIDEEDPRIGEYLDEDFLSKKKFIWALDPIDGTRLYANRMPLFGISLGLIKDRRPWLGVVYFPALNELFFCDGTKSYYVQHAFSVNEKRALIVPVDEKISAKSLFFCNDSFFDKYRWNDKDFHIMIAACAVVNLCWSALGRGCGCFLRCHIWDFAGSWPMIRAAGYDLRAVEGGKVLDKVDASFFTKTPRPWQMKEFYLISTQRNYGIIKSKMSPLPVRE